MDFRIFSSQINEYFDFFSHELFEVSSGVRQWAVMQVLEGKFFGEFKPEQDLLFASGPVWMVLTLTFYADSISYSSALNFR